MCKLVFTFLLFISFEIVLALIFYFVFPKANKITPISVFKGVLERTFLVVAMCNGFAESLSLFGALKLGTRLADANKKPDYNDIYLIGNLLSATAAILFVYLYNKYLK